MRVFLFLFLTSFIAQSQTFQLEGKIIDKLTKEPVAYANISFVKGSLGISSQENGSFSLEIPTKKLKEKVHISCLNYKDTIVFVNQIQQKTIGLQPKIYNLNEVVLSKKKTQKITLDKVKRRVFPMHSSNLKMIAKYFPNSLKGEYFFDKIKVHFARRASRKAKFRIRVFSVDEKTGKPKDDLLHKSIPVKIKEKQREVELDISFLDIEVPKKGFFIAFEKLLIPENKYFYRNHKNKKSIYHAPIIGMTKTKEIKSADCKIYLFNKGSWWESPKISEGDKWVPAISVTLTD